MKKQKLRLDDLKVVSFTTETQKIQGGSCACSLPTYPQRICDIACSDPCPSDECTWVC